MIICYLLFISKMLFYLFYTDEDFNLAAFLFNLDGTCTVLIVQECIHAFISRQRVIFHMPEHYPFE